MFDKLIAAALTRPLLAQRTLREELARLRAGGYLSEAELERLSRETLEALTARLAEAGAAAGPLVQGLGDTVREALDVPSRSEIVALTEELRRQRGETPGAPGAPDTPGQPPEPHPSADA